MNTSKQINMMVVVLFLMLIAAGAYTLYDPFRSESAEDEQLEKTVERGAHLFTLNCRVCHGDRGQGGSAGGRLTAALPLDNQDLRGFDESGQFSEDELKKDFLFVKNTITCGRAGTFMPTWGQDQGGTLNAEQLRQLAVFITEGDFWDVAQEEADKEDAKTNNNATVQMPDGSLAASETELVVDNAQPFNVDQAIRIGEGDGEERLRILDVSSTGQTLAEETGRTGNRFQVSGVQERDAFLRVERAQEDTLAAAHPPNATILVPPEEGAEEGTPPTDTGARLLQAVDPQDELFAVSDTLRIRAGDLIIVDQERMRVTEVEKARRPVQEGDIVRVEGELTRVTGVSDDGEAGVALAEPVAASTTRIQASDANRLRQQDVIRIDDELLRVVEPVSTERELREAIGPAEREFAVSGIGGIEEGMIIRLEGEERFHGELMRVVRLGPSRVRVERAADDTQAAGHGGGGAIFSIEAPPEAGAGGEEEVIEDTEQTLVEAIGADDDTLVVTGSEGVSVGATIQIDAERLSVVDIEQARLAVERGVEDTEALAHASGITIFEDNLIDVERGFADSSATAHGDGAAMFRFVLEVERAVEGSPLQDHNVNSEVFLGNSLIVERGIRDSEAREHENGALVYNFPEPPDKPATTQVACGQRGGGGATTPAGATPTPAAGAQEVDIVARNIAFDKATITVQTGRPAVVHFDNQDQAVPHNFAVYEDSSAADPLSGSSIGAVCDGPCKEDIQFDAPDPGTYFFRCDIHPTQMTGAFVVQ